MKFFRNSEVIKNTVIMATMSVIATTLAFLWKGSFGVFTLILCSVLCFFHILSTYKRYQRLSDLAADINKILHNDNPSISLDKYSEGEISILYSEVHKMTWRLLEQRQQLNADKIHLSNSIADISHQIRTPLTSINLLVELLAEPDISEDRKIKLTHELLALLSRIEWLITTLLKLSKLDAGTVLFKKEKITLKDLIDKSVSPLLVPIELKEQNIEIETNGDFYGDISWTCEAVGNIVKNCVEHTPVGGTVKIVGKENPLFAEITISDNGTGIAKDDLPHIFERFYKGHGSSEKSFGIGLALSRMIITGQNGTIKAENNASQGALFTIRFYKGTV